LRMNGLWGIQGAYFQSFQRTGRTAMTEARDSDEHICADAVAVDDHL